MAGFDIDIDISGDEIAAHLQRLQRSASDTSEAMLDITEHIVSLVDFTFFDETDPYGKPWASIKRDGQILQDTGVLKGSIAPGSTSGMNESVIGSKIEYAPHQQFGTGKGIAQRMFLPTDGMPDDWGDDILEIINNHLNQAI